MLVLGRKAGEKLCIGNNIGITVLGIHGNVVKLGIEAPRDVRVLRSELQRSIPAVRVVAQCRASTFDA
jgi:carbon storage regulator